MVKSLLWANPKSALALPHRLRLRTETDNAAIAKSSDEVRNQQSCQLRNGLMKTSWGPCKQAFKLVAAAAGGFGDGCRANVCELLVGFASAKLRPTRWSRSASFQRR